MQSNLQYNYILITKVTFWTWGQSKFFLNNGLVCFPFKVQTVVQLYINYFILLGPLTHHSWRLLQWRYGVTDNRWRYCVLTDGWLEPFNRLIPYFEYVLHTPEYVLVSISMCIRSYSTHHVCIIALYIVLAVGGSACPQ